MLTTLNQEISSAASSKSTSSNDVNRTEIFQQPEPPPTPPTTDTATEMSFCSGLSALIQAATSQLGQSIDQVENNQGPSEEDNQTRTLLTSLEGEDSNNSFPASLMTLLLDPKNVDIITFLPDGTYFAIRTKEFSQGPMCQQFPDVKTFKDFLALTQQWGFTRMCGNSSTADSKGSGEEDAIQVFRHPNFNRNEVEGLSKMKFGQNPTEARMSAIPEKLSKMHLTPNTNNANSDITSSKRRLSPSHAERDTEDSIQKSHRVDEGEALTEGEISIARTLSNDSEWSGRRRSSTTEIRSYVTAEFDIQSGESGEGNEASPPKEALGGTSTSTKTASASLVQGGVERATHTIVTDAIESLLFDEGHTRETYLKHEQELSKSSLPGVVPISKQLFSPSEGVANTISMAEHNATEGSTSLTTNGHGKDGIAKENKKNAL